jgi:hypothetical protein
MGERLVGRRLPDTKRGELPDVLDRLRPGDYWKRLDEAGDPVRVDNPGNLTGTSWHVVVPMPSGYGLGWLEHHTVREHEDGTISVRPGDGSSNSILVTGHHGQRWHGYIEHGEFYES